jgi:hypothetical protein
VDGEDGVLSLDAPSAIVGGSFSPTGCMFAEGGSSPNGPLVASFKSMMGLQREAGR